MNPDAPRTPREELEIQITALLMGQLPAEEAAALEAKIAADPELAALHARLRHAAELLRASRAIPEPAAPAAPLQLSPERREKLLAAFRGIKPLPSPTPVAAPPAQRSPRKWVRPVVLAASIAVLLGGGVVYLMSGGMYGAHKASAPAREISPADGEEEWTSQAGAIRFLGEGKPSYKVYAQNGMADPLPASSPRVLGSGQTVPGIYLPSTAPEAPSGPEPATAAPAESDYPVVDPRAAIAQGRGRIEGFWTDQMAGASGSAPPQVERELTRRSSRADVAMAGKDADPQGSRSLGDRYRETLDPQEKEVLQKELGALYSFGNLPADGAAGIPLLPSNPVAAGNRSVELANPHAIDALLFDERASKEAAPAEGAESEKKEGGAARPGEKVIQQLAQDAEDYVELGRYNLAERKYEEILNRDPNNVAARKGRTDVYALKNQAAQEGYDAARSQAMWDVTSHWERPYRSFNRAAGGEPKEIRAGDSQGSAGLADAKRMQDGQKPNADEFQRSPGESAAGNVNTAGENTYWDTERAGGMVGRVGAGEGEKPAPTVASPLGAFQGRVDHGNSLFFSGGTSGAPAPLDVRDLDDQISPPDGQPFEPPQIPQTFGTSGNGAEGSPWFHSFPVTPTTPIPQKNEPSPADSDADLAKEALAEVQFAPVERLSGIAASEFTVSEPLSTAGKVQLDSGVMAPFGPSTPPGQPPSYVKAPAKPSTATAPQQQSGKGIDPAQEAFVNAFLSVRKAEEEAAAGNSQNALEKYRSAAETLEKIKQQWPKWQPELLEYRLKRTQKAVSDLEAKTKAEPAATEREAAKPVPAAEPAQTPQPPQPPPVPQPEVSTKENAFSTFSLNVSDVSFQLASAALEKGVMPEPATVRSEEFINAFNYRDPEPAPGVPLAFASERARYPFAHNRDLLRLSVKTAAAGREPGRPLNLVLVLDNSGSMERADRVRILKESLRVLTQQLQPQDKLSLITFSRNARLWADGVAGDKAAEFTQRVGEITPEGGTDLSAALDLGYKTALKHYGVGSVNRVVLLTDGAANLGEVKADALKVTVEAHRKQGVAFDCFGVGWEGYNDDLLEELSRNGDGRYGFINTPEAAATEFAGQLAGALRVAASDVKVQVEFNPRRVSAYRQIGYAKHQLKKEQFRDNTVDAAEIGAAESGNALYAIEVNSRGEGDIATVRVRFKVPGTADYREHEWAVPFQAPAPAMEQASSSLRLAATASAFSEWLAQSPFAADVTTDRLLGLINGIPAIYGADPRPGKLEWMIRQAKSVSGR